MVLAEEETAVLGADPHRERVELAGPPAHGEAERQLQFLSCVSPVGRESIDLERIGLHCSLAFLRASAASRYFLIKR